MHSLFVKKQTTCISLLHYFWHDDKANILLSHIKARRKGRIWKGRVRNKERKEKSKVDGRRLGKKRRKKKREKKEQKNRSYPTEKYSSYTIPEC